MDEQQRLEPGPKLGVTGDHARSFAWLMLIVGTCPRGTRTRTTGGFQGQVATSSSALTLTGVDPSPSTSAEPIAATGDQAGRRAAGRAVGATSLREGRTASPCKPDRTSITGLSTSNMSRDPLQQGGSCPWEAEQLASGRAQSKADIVGGRLWPLTERQLRSTNPYEADGCCRLPLQPWSDCFEGSWTLRPLFRRPSTATNDRS